MVRLTDYFLTAENAKIRRGMTHVFLFYTREVQLVYLIS